MTPRAPSCTRSARSWWAWPKAAVATWRGAVARSRRRLLARSGAACWMPSWGVVTEEREQRQASGAA